MKNADDHRFIQSMAKKYGLYFSRPGNGICHQVHLERFGKPGKTLIGSDSHTPTGGGIGMLAMGAGGLDVAVAMGGGAYYITMPKMYKVNLTGKLRDFVTAKDVSLEILEDSFRKRRSRRHHRVGRARNQDAVRTGKSDDHQYGNRARSDDFHFPF